MLLYAPSMPKRPHFIHLCTPETQPRVWYTVIYLKIFVELNWVRSLPIQSIWKRSQPSDGAIFLGASGSLQCLWKTLWAIVTTWTYKRGAWWYENRKSCLFCHCSQATFALEWVAVGDKNHCLKHTLSWSCRNPMACLSSLTVLRHCPKNLPHAAIWPSI